jgi:uncharacterized protein YhaN
MAVAKKALLIEYELEFLEKQLEELKEYIEANPYSTLTDRMQYKETKNGGMVSVCVANKESQRKDLTQALKDYAEILRTVDSMREKQEAKAVPVRGDVQLGSMAEDFLKGRK